MEMMGGAGLVLFWSIVAGLFLVHVTGTLYLVRHRRRTGSSQLAAALWGLFGFIAVPLAWLFLTGLLTDFAANWTSRTQTLNQVSLAIFPILVVFTWGYAICYWQVTRGHRHREPRSLPLRQSQ